MTQIKQLIKRMSNPNIMQTYLCEVENVDGLKCDCKPVHGGASFFDVRLKSILDDSENGLILTPKKGSLVLVGLIENNEASAFIVQYSDIEELTFKNVNGMSFEVLKGVLKLNGDSEGGLVQIKELKENIDSIKQYVEAMNTALPIAFKAILASTSANGALGEKSYKLAMATQKIILKDMENQKVKHGS